MQKNLIDYVKIFKNAIDENTRNRSLLELDNNKGWEQHLFYNYQSAIDHGTEPLVYRGNVISTYPILMDTIWNSLRDYINNFNFQWYNSWNGFDTLKFIQYNTNTEMKNHCDHIHSMFEGKKRGIPVLTVIGLLNDDFEGGNLILFEDEHVELQAGDIIIFPSVFLYPHAVEKISKGKRFSFATWVY